MAILSFLSSNYCFHAKCCLSEEGFIFLTHWLSSLLFKTQFLDLFSAMTLIMSDLYLVFSYVSKDLCFEFQPVELKVRTFDSQSELLSLLMICFHLSLKLSELFARCEITQILAREQTS